jgi:hypothetical protein
VRIWRFLKGQYVFFFFVVVEFPHFVPSLLASEWKIEECIDLIRRDMVSFFFFKSDAPSCSLLMRVTVCLFSPFLMHVGMASESWSGHDSPDLSTEPLFQAAYR